MFWRERPGVGEISAESVDAWIEANFAKIHKELERERLKQLEDKLRKGVGWVPALDRRLRWLSEMPLCEFWERKKITFPHGFKKNYAKIYAGIHHPDEYHVFAAAGDQILCLTPGQYVRSDGENLGPGDRIKILQEKAPDLIKIYGDGVARLFGERDDIYNRLGISYC